MQFIKAVKNLLRTPLKTVIMLLLMGAAAYLLISSAASLYNDSRDLNKMLDYYQVTGSLKSTEKNSANPNLTAVPLDAVNAICESKYVTATDSRIIAPMVAQNQKHLNSRGGGTKSIMDAVYFEGTIRSEILKLPSGSLGSMTVSVDKILAGSCEAFKENDVIQLLPPRESVYADGGYIAPSPNGNIWGIATPDAKEYKLEKGKKYFFQMSPHEMPDGKTAYSMEGFFMPITTADYLDAKELCYMPGGNAYYFSAKAMIEREDANLHTFEGLFLRDMGILPAMQNGEIALTRGREITPQDTENGNQVCIISELFALKHGLDVGDKLDFTIKRSDGGRYYADDHYYGINDRITQEEIPQSGVIAIEIVGVYDFLKLGENPITSPSINTIILPIGVYNAQGFAEKPQGVLPINFTYELRSPLDLEDFRIEMSGKLPSLSADITMNDNGFSNLGDSIKSVKRSSQVNFGIGITAFIAGTILVAYLYILRKKGEYAIMRALGESKKTSSVKLACPMLIICICSVLAAGAIAMLTAKSGFAGLEQAVLPQGFVPSQGMNIAVIAALCVATLGAMLLIVLFGIHRVGKHSPLELLQKRAR